MELNQPWLLLVGVGLVLAAVAAGVLLGRRPGRREETAGVPVSRAERLRALPGFERAVRRRSRTLTAVLLLAALTVLLASAIAARPMTAKTVRPISHNRDVVLCLDVSGSMTEVDAEVLATFQELLRGFEGERIGLTIFNSSAAQVFPLTDDYAFVSEQVEALQRSFAFETPYPEHWIGTNNGAGASLIGDGLAACALRFDNLEDERSRSIIFATDNEIFGASIVSLTEAAEYAKSKDITVYTLNPVDGENEEDTGELRAATELTGGSYFPLRSAVAVDSIIQRITAEEQRALEGQARVLRTDAPDPWAAGLLLLGAGAIVLMWRVRL